MRAVGRAAPFALQENPRKTERGAERFRVRSVVRAAPSALGRRFRHGAGGIAGALDARSARAFS